ncbi:MAG: TonB-dependent receptor [Acidobacteria bacterium]|nr:TonB-dependent receptor [Acidobacteriota bacterium]
MRLRPLARLPPMLGLAVLFVFAPQLAGTQDEGQMDADAIEQAEEEGLVRLADEVTVTGSLIPRDDLSSLSPVTLVNPDEITYQGTGRVEDLIQNLPQVFVAQNASWSNGATGTATVDLRNLGQVRTLVLLNGRRMASGDAFATAPDLNFIPSALVKRVDILTGGASSVYGADAVSGVVNFILDTEFEGFRGEVMWNGFQHNNNNSVAQAANEAVGYDYPSGNIFNNGGYNFNFAVGGRFGGGKGHASAYVDYRDIEAVWKDQRDYTNCSVQGLGDTGPACGGSSTWQHGRFITDTGDYVLDPRTGNTTTFRPRQGSDVFNYASYSFLQRNDEKWSGGAFARYSVSEHFEPYAEVMVMDDYSDAQIAPSGNFANTSVINCDNPMLSEQQRQLTCGDQTSGYATMIMLRRNVEGGNRIGQLRHINWRLLGGIRGDITDFWSYDVYALNANVNSPSGSVNDLHHDRIFEALDVVGTPGDPSTWACRSGNPSCYPWNVFTVGAVDPRAPEFMAAKALISSGTNTKMLGATLTGDLQDAGLVLPSASEGIQLAVGTEIRKESLFVNPDEVFAQGLLAGSGGGTNPVDGNYSTREFFAEALVPLVQDVSGASDLSLELGYRFANYKAMDQEAKNNSSYKALLSWAPVNGFRIRGGINRAVRAPNVQELFQPQGRGLGGSEDICAGPNPQATVEQCARTGVSPENYGSILENPAAQYNSLYGGNPDLDVERADTLTVGVVWTPPSVPGLSVTFDYYTIEIDDTISSLQPDDVVRTCAETGDPQLCGLIHRDAFETLWLTPDAYTISTDQNIGTLKARGIDVAASYPWNLGDLGYINFAMTGSSMLEWRLTTPLIDYDCAGFMGNQCFAVLPKWRHRARASWVSNFNTTFTLGWRFLGHVMNDDASPNPTIGNPALEELWKSNGSWEFPAYNWFDLAVTYRFRDNLHLTGGCNNLLDKEPPLGAGLVAIDYAAGHFGQYDYMGRSLFANLRFDF